MVINYETLPAFAKITWLNSRQFKRVVTRYENGINRIARTNGKGTACKLSFTWDCRLNVRGFVCVKLFERLFVDVIVHKWTPTDTDRREKIEVVWTDTTGSEKWIFFSFLDKYSCISRSPRGAHLSEVHPSSPSFNHRANVLSPFSLKLLFRRTSHDALIYNVIATRCYRVT